MTIAFLLTEFLERRALSPVTGWAKLIATFWLHLDNLLLEFLRVKSPLTCHRVSKADCHFLVTPWQSSFGVSLSEEPSHLSSVVPSWLPLFGYTLTTFLQSFFEGRSLSPVTKCAKLMPLFGYTLTTFLRSFFECRALSPVTKCAKLIATS